MSYRYEKNQKGGQDLVISGWEQGIGDSSLVGHQQMQNVDIFSFPGVLQAGFKSTLSKTTTELVLWMRRDPKTGDIYALDKGGALYKYTWSSSTWATLTGVPSNVGAGLGIWKGYLFIPRSTTLTCAQLPVTNGSTWVAVEDTLGHDMAIENIAWHPIFTNLNTDHLFFGNKFKVGQIKELTTFDPTTAETSYIASNNVLDLPSYYTIQTIEGLGNNVYLGTFLSSTASTSGYDRMSAVIFPWDKVSDSYDNPIQSAGTGVHQLKTIGSQMYAYVGNRNDISITNGSTTQLLKKFYNISLDSASTLTDINPDAIDALNNQEVLFGIGDRTGSPSPVGIYSMRDSAHLLRNLPSTGNTVDVRIGSILALDAQRFMFSWRDQNGSTSYGIDIVGDGDRYTDYTAQVDTDLIPVSTFLYSKEFSEVEFKLASPLISGQGIKIWWRTDLTSAWTLINEWTYTTIGARMSYEDTASITDAEYLQLRIQLKAVGHDSPQLSEIRLR